MSPRSLSLLRAVQTSWCCRVPRPVFPSSWIDVRELTVLSQLDCGHSGSIQTVHTCKNTRGANRTGLGRTLGDRELKFTDVLRVRFNSKSFVYSLLISNQGHLC